jgi:hypothetical protein
MICHGFKGRVNAPDAYGLYIFADSFTNSIWSELYLRGKYRVTTGGRCIGSSGVSSIGHEEVGLKKRGPVDHESISSSLVHRIM